LKKHLLKLYFSNLVFLAFNLVLLNYMIPVYRTLPFYTGLWVGLHSGFFFGLCLPFSIGLIQRKLEKEADTYAAKIVGSERYKNMLIKLNEVTKGGLETWAFNYPKLKERLENVDAEIDETEHPKSEQTEHPYQE